MNTIPFNIWDDYSESENYSSTYGYVEEYDVLSEKDKEAICFLIYNQIIQLENLDFLVKDDCDQISFEKLSHDRREKLVKELNKLELKYNNKLIDFYSES